MLPWVLLLCTWAAIDARSKTPIDWPAPRLDMRGCVDSLAATHPDAGDVVAVFAAGSDACAAHLHQQGLLDDFQIRRAKFHTQGWADTIILWMVVFITVSGILLSGAQLAASYKLAAAAKAADLAGGGEMSIETGRMSVRSSVTGLLILIASLAFFWLFTLRIYPIDEVSVDGPMQEVARQRFASPSPVFQFGGVGPIPSEQQTGSLATGNKAVGKPESGASD